MENIKLRNFLDSDMENMKKWLDKKYISKWYLNSEDWLEELEKRNTEFFWINHLIIEKDSIVIGFCQYYDCYYANNIEDWYNVERPNHIFSIDYLIGEESYLGKGYGKKVVSLLTETIRKNKKIDEIIVQPDEKNIASIKVLTANGYIYDEEREYYRKILK